MNRANPEKGKTMTTAIHNVPSMEAQRQRDVALARFNGKAFDPDAEYARLKGEVARIKTELASITPERIQSAVEKALRPLAAEIALTEKEQVENVRRHAHLDFSDVDLNAIFDEPASADAARFANRADPNDEFAGYDLNAAMEG